MFTLALESCLKTKNVKVNGYSLQTLPSNIRPDLVFQSLVLPKGNPIFAPRFTDYR